jgi:CDP-diacylglycerol---glycerol-3-phosphate 3-phosphatidyltransferase
MFDGAMARFPNAATSFGAFLDSTLDCYSESIILFGLLWCALRHPDQHDPFWSAPAEQSWMIIFIFLAVVSSLLVSYTKTRAEGLGIECKIGLLARPERVVILAIGLLSHTGIWALALLAVLTDVTAMERTFAIWQGTHKTPEVHDATTHNAHETSTDNHHLPTMAETNQAREGRHSTTAH